MKWEGMYDFAIEDCVRHTGPENRAVGRHQRGHRGEAEFAMPLVCVGHPGGQGVGTFLRIHAASQSEKQNPLREDRREA